MQNLMSVSYQNTATAHSGFAQKVESERKKLVLSLGVKLRPPFSTAELNGSLH